MLRQTGATRLISLLSDDTAFLRPAQIGAGDHLVLRFNDITEPRDGLVLPAQTHIEQLIRFAKFWDQKYPLLVHCWAGISRSPAAAVIIAMALEPRRDVFELASTLRSLSPSATPNIRMIELADSQFGLNSELVRAMKGIGRGRDACEGNPFEILHPGRLP